MSTDEAKNESTEFAYTQRDEFTSEIYKIEITNMGIFGMGELKKMLKNKLSLDACKVKSPKRRGFAFICFRSKEDQERAITLLNGYVWKGKTLKATIAKATPDPLVKRRLEQQNDGGTEQKRPKTSAEATCPLAGIPYEDQLKQKHVEMEEILKGLGKELSKLSPDYKKLIAADKNQLPCKFLGIKPAPKIDGYRNKSEFAIGKNSDGEVVVGFRVGAYADGSLEVGAIDDLPHIPEKMKKAAQIFQKYVAQSKFQIFNPEQNSGHFRQLGVRTSEAIGEVMVIVGVYSQNLNETELVELKAEVKDFFENYDKTEFVCDSLYYQDLKRREAGQMFYPVELLAGKTHICDEIHGLKFRISPLAFFQINTLGAEVLYNQAIELSDLKPYSTVLDICCGTGTIGLCFAKKCKQVLGVEIVPDAVKDAEFNAEANSISNCKFYAGNADDYIQSLVREATYSCLTSNELDMVAVVDPPRAGLHSRSIVAIRSAHNLNRLVYVSCHPRGARRNWIDLARPESKLYQNAPFLPKVAVAVDMFPHTSHTELVVLFERTVDHADVEEKKAETKLEENTEKLEVVDDTETSKADN